MRYQALLFSADEKASRVVSQILSELDFHVEACTEPFAAVKQITNEHFDALVVDCEDEQNATLLFKSARNSNSNSDSLAVALVQGQGAIAKAFRIGANLILTKPINAEQSKGTLRTAKGLLRQAQAAKAVAAAAASSSPAPLAAEPAKSTEPAADISPAPEPPASALPVNAEFSVGAVTGALEQQAEEFPALGAAEAALIESMPEPLPAQAASAVDPQQPIGDEPAAKVTTTALAIISSPGSAATAAAPAKENVSPAASPEDKVLEKPGSAPVPEKAIADTSSAKPKPAAKLAPRVDPPKFAQMAGKNLESRQSGNNRNLLIAAVLVLATAGAIFYAWPQLEPFLSRVPLVQKYLGLPQSQSQAPATISPSAPANASATSTASAQPQSSQANPVPSQTTPAGEQSNAVPATSADKASDVSTSSPAASSQVLPQLAPDAAAALLMQKVDPVYPSAARQQGIQGSVQLQANIGKDGTTSNIKVLSGKPILATAAAAAVQQWKYQPYKVDGQPTEVQTQITVDFKLP